MNPSGTVTKVNVFAHDGLVARGLGSTWTYYLFDPQGSVAQRTGNNGTVTSSSKYEAYGKHVNIPGSITDVYGWNARWGYCFDSETGLYLCQQRYYDSSQGRWLNRDPARYSGGINLYGYCGGGPVGTIDPEGEDAAALAEFAVRTMGAGGITTQLDSPLPGPCDVIGGVIIVGGLVLLVTAGITKLGEVIWVSAEEHKKNQNEANRQKHERGRARNKRDHGNEKGDKNRTPWKWKRNNNGGNGGIGGVIVPFSDPNDDVYGGWDPRPVIGSGGQVYWR